MKNFRIVFANSPWWLLLLVPAVGFTLLSYFRLAKRYRKTRNRITSMVLHMLVMFFSVATLSGMVFHYEVPNEKNEIILLVDVSDTEETASKTRDKFVERVLTDGRYGNYKIGVVTFGFDQEYAVPMTYDIKKIYGAYESAQKPDTSATDVASALEYTRGLFKNPKSSKIVLISDGKQTDREAAEVIRTITAQGTKIDVANVPSKYEGTDVYVKSVEFPEYHINAGEEFTITLKVESNEAKTVDISLFDNGDKMLTKQEVSLPVGEYPIEFSYTFEKTDDQAKSSLHEISFEVSSNGDVLTENNTYTAYYYLAVFNKVLVVERVENESDALVAMLGEEYDVTVTCVLDSSKETGMPTTVEQLREYDQVILNNIANDDMPKGFDVILESYVKDYGGGLFTAGGKKDDGGKMVSNAYNERDMYGSTYQKMLPVEAITYTPPMGLVLVIDRSGSMGDTDLYGVPYLRTAKAIALACLNALSERDYISIMTLDDDQSVILPMTSRAQDTVIRDSIEAVDFDTATGGTVYPNAVNRAGQALLNETRVARKHMIMISDGATAGDEVELCVKMLENFYEQEITFSFVGVKMKANDPNYKMMETMVTAGHGNIMVASGEKMSSELLNAIHKELVVTKVESMNDGKEFHPAILDQSSPLVSGLDRYVNEKGELEKDKLSVKLYGYHGTKAREEADVILKGEYNIPIYAQWKYGAGTVGSLMCDLQSATWLQDSWSRDFVGDKNGIAFIRNVVNNLMPSTDIRVKKITYSLIEDNYTNQLSVFAKLEKDQTIKASLYTTTNGVVSEEEISLNEKTEKEKGVLRESPCYVTLALGIDNNYTRCDFVVKKGGVYKIVLQIVDKEGKPIVDEDGQVLDNTIVTFFKSFAYSEEYLPTSGEIDAMGAELLASIAEKAKGSVVQNLEDPSEVFEGFETTLPESFDPRYLFMILALVCFLTDIAVRKFKFKWPHEIIREYREKKRNSKKN